MNTIFGATFVERWFEDVLSANCSRETVSGKMFAGKRSVRFAHTAHASLMGAYAPKRSANRALSREGRGVLSGVNKLTTANLCDRKKTADVGARDTMTHQ